MMNPEKTDTILEQIASNATTWEDEYKGYLQALQDVQSGKIRLPMPEGGWIPSDIRERLENRIDSINKDIQYKSKNGIPGIYLNNLYGEMRGLQWVLEGMKDETV